MAEAAKQIGPSFSMIKNKLFYRHYVYLHTANLMELGKFLSQLIQLPFV